MQESTKRHTRPSPHEPKHYKGLSNKPLKNWNL